MKWFWAMMVSLIFMVFSVCVFAADFSHEVPADNAVEAAVDTSLDVPVDVPEIGGFVNLPISEHASFYCDDQTNTGVEGLGVSLSAPRFNLKTCRVPALTSLTGLSQTNALKVGRLLLWS